MEKFTYPTFNICALYSILYLNTFKKCIIRIMGKEVNIYN